MPENASEITLTSQQQEGFAWWLNQDKKGRSNKSVQAKFGIANATARAWVSKFNKLLKEQAKTQIAISLNTFKEEYANGQKQAVRISEQLLSIYSDLATTSQDDAECDIDELNKLVNGAKVAYSLLEQASGADLAKSAVKAKALQNAKTGQIEGNSNSEKSLGWLNEVEV